MTEYISIYTDNTESDYHIYTSCVLGRSDHYIKKETSVNATK